MPPLLPRPSAGHRILRSPPDPLIRSPSPSMIRRCTFRTASSETSSECRIRVTLANSTKVRFMNVLCYFIVYILQKSTFSQAISFQAPRRFRGRMLHRRYSSIFTHLICPGASLNPYVPHPYVPLGKDAKRDAGDCLLGGHSATIPPSAVGYR